MEDKILFGIALAWGYIVFFIVMGRILLNPHY